MQFVPLTVPLKLQQGSLVNFTALTVYVHLIKSPHDHSLVIHNHLGFHGNARSLKPYYPIICSSSRLTRRDFRYTMSYSALDSLWWPHTQTHGSLCWPYAEFWVWCAGLCCHCSCVCVCTFSMLCWCWCSLSRSVGMATLMNFWMGGSRRRSGSFPASSAIMTVSYDLYYKVSGLTNPYTVFF